MLQTALHNHAVAISHPRVTRRAINIEALLPPPEDLRGHRERHVIAGIRANLPGIEISVIVQLPTRDRIFNRWPCGALIGIKIILSQRLKPRLIVHILPTSGKHKERRCPG